ncbi:MAG: DUF58 domain-containing protein [Pedosphaera sp. Tous-C6FEB]|nr:MAG: DUF58 domain-containing protein [Pedosphaera sp. Tous-C6FEB]
MIVPRTRLLTWFALLALPFATLAVALPETAALTGGLAGLFVLLALLDAVMGLGALDGLSVELPKVVRLSKNRPGELDLHVVNASQRQREVRLGLPFPRELASAQEDLTALLPAKAERAKLTWPFQPLKRGNFVLDQCYLEAASPLGFWSVRGTTPTQCEVRVYPNLLTERKSVAALFLNRGQFGIHALRQVGKGRDFEKLREYVPGDDYGEIHWKATAKRGKPVTKVFQIERTQEVYVVIDASRLSAREASVQSSVISNQSGKPDASDGTPLNTENCLLKTSVLERYLTAALVLGLAAEQQGDLFGLLTFSDRVQSFVRAKNGKAHYAHCRDALYTLQPQLVSPDFEELASFLRVRLRRRALVIVLTALDDPLLAEQFERSMELLCRQHLILVNMMQPPGARPLFAAPDVEKVDDVYQRLGGHLLWHRLREMGKSLQHRGVTFNLLDNERLSAQLVTQYLQVKRRQLI